jgi:hypothetical protein
MAATRVYEELIDFIAAGTSPQEVADYRPSEEARDRIHDLVRREKTDGLTPDESAELQNYLQLEHIMRLAKARARQRLSSDQLGH